MVSIGVLLLSIPALGKDPFVEIALDSWIDLRLRELTDSGLVQVDYGLVLPQAGQPLLRFEGAMLVGSALEHLLTYGIDPNSTRPLGFSEGEILAWVRELANNYTRVTGDSFNPGQIESLALLVREFGPELQILTGILGQKPITLRVGSGEPWEFVDIDEISGGESKPEVISDNANNESTTQPSWHLMQLAAEYFDYTVQLQLLTAESANLAALRAEFKPDIAPPIFGPAESGVTSLSLEPQYLSWRRASQQQITLDEQTGEIATTSLYILDGQVPIGSGFTLGTVWATDKDMGLVTELSGFKKESRLTRAVSGEFQVVPTVSIIGELARSSVYSKIDDKETETEAKKLGAKVKLGEVELGANLRAVEAGFDPLTTNAKDSTNTSGYDLSFKFKNLTLATEYSKNNLLNAETTGQKSTSLNLNYSFAQRAVLKAGYKFVDIDKVESPTDPEDVEDPLTPLTVKEQQEAFLGFDAQLDDNTKLEAGFTLGWAVNPEGSVRSFDTKKASAGVLWRLPWEGDLEIRADYEIDANKSQSRTKLGVGYNFLDNASLLVGYQLISFDSVDNSDEVKPQTNLSAELSIQF